MPPQALGPGPRETTKFFVALNVPQVRTGRQCGSHGCCLTAKRTWVAWPTVQSCRWPADATASCCRMPQASLAPSSNSGAAGEAQEAAAAWRDLEALLGETAGSAVAGNQLVSVLRQLQAMMKR